MLIVVLAGGGSNAKAAIKTIRAQGCQYHKYPAQPRTPHYATLNPTPAAELELVPADERPALLPAAARSGSTPRSMPEIRLVHNLEHGAVILQYGDKVPPRQVQQITAWYQQDANAIVVAPLPKLGDKVALTAWTDWTECNGFNLKARTRSGRRSATTRPSRECSRRAPSQPGQ